MSILSEWYDNKDLFEMINGLKEDLQETREVIQKYNGLRQTQGQMKEDIQCLKNWQQQTQGHKEGKKDMSYWIKWAVILLLSVSNFLALWGVI